MNREKRMMCRWSAVSVLIIAIFWTIWYFVTGSVPVSKFFSAPNWLYQIGISRWFDIIMGPICSVVFIRFFKIGTNEKKSKNNLPITGMQFGLIFGLMFGFINGVGVIVGNLDIVIFAAGALGLILGLFVRERSFVGAMLGNLLIGGLTVGLIGGLCSSLLIGLAYLVGVILVILIKSVAVKKMWNWLLVK